MEFKEQVKAYNEVKPLVEKMQKEGTIPEDVYAVFKANSKKLKMVNDLYKREKVWYNDYCGRLCPRI